MINLKSLPIVERVCDWVTGLLFVSEIQAVVVVDNDDVVTANVVGIVDVAVVVVVVVIIVFNCVVIRLSWSAVLPTTSALVIVVIDGGVKPVEFVEFVDDGNFDDQKLHVSQPSAFRLDKRQHDQRLPLQRPAW